VFCLFFTDIQVKETNSKEKRPALLELRVFPLITYTSREELPKFRCTLSLSDVSHIIDLIEWIIRIDDDLS
jgi:hypothetical protein